MFLYKIKDVAEILSCSERHVWTLISQGKLKKILLGSRSARVSELSLQEFISSQEVSK